MAKTRHGLYAVVHDATPIPGVNRLGWTLNGRTIGDPTAAELYARNRVMVGQEPRLTFATRALATALGLCGTAGTSIGGLTSGLIAYQQKFSHGGTRAGTLSHRKIVLLDGLLYPQRITCAHQQNAELTYEAVATWDGTNDPFVLTESQTLPAAPTDAERFSLGPVTIGSVVLDQIMNFDLEIGLRVVVEATDSDIWPTYAYIAEWTPRLTLRGKKSEWWAAAGIPMAGKAATHANTTAYLRKRTQTSYVANATAQHIKFTMDGLAYLTDIFDASGVATGETALVIEGEYDGSNAPVTITTASAIA